MSRIDEQLDRRPADGSPPGRGSSTRDLLRSPRLATVAAVVVTVAVVLAAVVLSQRLPAEQEVTDAPPAAPAGPPVDGDMLENSPADGDMLENSPADGDTLEDSPDEASSDAPPASEEPAPADEPAADPAPAGDPAPAADPAPAGDPAPDAQPALIEVRDQRLYLVDANGQVLRTLRDAHDGSQEYTLRNVALRPGSTTSDLAVAFVEGYMTGTLRVLVVRDGGEPDVVEPGTTVDYELHDQQPMALPAGVWSPDGAFLAWLEPDPANRAVLRAMRWTAAGPAGAATPPGGIPVDPEGLMAADETRGLELDGWASGAVEHLRARAYRPHEGGAERRYTIGLQRQDGQLQAQPLARG